MKASSHSRPACKPPMNKKMYGGNLSIARVGASIALVLVTLLIALAQNGGGTDTPKSSTPGRFALGEPTP